MKLELLQEDLNKALSIVSRFVAARPQLPILSSILFSAQEDNKLCLAATNLEIGIQYWLGAKVTEPGQMALPAKDLTEFISYLSPGKITLESGKKIQVKIVSVGGESSFAGMDGKEFPKIPQINQDEIFSLPKESLSEAVAKVGFAAASDDTRPVLEAINWQFTKDGYRMVATDGYRLSLKDVSGIKVKMKKETDSVSFLIPCRSLTEITHLADNKEEIKLGLTADGNQVVLVLEELQLASRLIEGNFPDYQKIIPKEAKTKVTLGREELLQAIKTASVFARGSSNIVKLEIKEGSVVVSANAPSVGENKTEIEAKVVGEGLRIAFNFRFVLDFLSAVPNTEKEIVLELTENLAPGVFKIPADPSYLHLIMPVRVDL
ncbi:DNA polymerase III subunit beta [Patescibacteria group bacterium]|nr:DNA polymerase III subunit beta [Patescibacteria group bacterium]